MKLPNWLRRKPVTRVYTLSLPDPEYWESIRGLAGTSACLFFKYPPVVITFDEDADRVQEIMGGKIFHVQAGHRINQQALQFVKENQDEIRAALGTVVCICDKERN